MTKLKTAFASFLILSAAGAHASGGKAPGQDNPPPRGCSLRDSSVASAQGSGSSYAVARDEAEREVRNELEDQQWICERDGKTFKSCEITSIERSSGQIFLVEASARYTCK